ncbi:MAG: bifunctional riboflavin kinase/FAD synthetase [Thermodesulfovibrionales bacterium]|nr:bifunctional riboflavin kinase/FAD synthetase [Thermodesulfovibrionales bacterium]
MMEIIRGLGNLNKSYPNTVLTIGNFDGVHLGHQKILSMVMKEARARKGTPIVMTFDPHPMKVLAPERDVRLLITFEEKVLLMKRAGVRVLLSIPFTKEFANMLPEHFITEVLVNKIRAKAIIIGSQYVFGKHKKGTIDLLRRRGKKYGFSVHAVRHAKVHGHIVSSSSIRALLMKGAMKEVSLFLGRAYSIEGKVIRGKGRGQKILHIPTANITTPVEISPKEGVYAVRIGWKGNIFNGVANIGKNPTFGDADVSYEVHIFNFSGNLLGENLRIYFMDRIRNEQTFPDPESLEKRIRKDMKQAGEILNTLHMDL